MSFSYSCFSLCLYETTSADLQWESPNTYALILIVAIIHATERNNCYQMQDDYCLNVAAHLEQTHSPLGCAFVAECSLLALCKH